MGLFGNLKRKKSKKPRVFVLGLDGVPYTLLPKIAAEGGMPRLQAVLESGLVRQMDSVLPVVSSVAWATFFTGVNPAKHNIFGFVDRKPDPFEIFIPTAYELRAKTLWQTLSGNGKRVGIINVPSTYPPSSVNGFLVSGFLATDLNRAVHPPSLAPRLQAMDYRIDSDSALARSDKHKFMENLNLTLRRRRETILSLYRDEEWDYFHAHIMETDRLHHFFWEDYEDGTGFAKDFVEFYRGIDSLIGDVEAEVGDETILVILSDHGFCRVKKGVFVNKWLLDQGLLRFDKEHPENIGDRSENSLAYSLIPGRIFIQLKDREQGGWVPPGAEYESARQKVREALLRMIDPESGEKIIREVFRRESIYSGPYLDRAADLIAASNDGFDLKANVNVPALTAKGSLQGAHTFHDAFLFIRGNKIGEPKPRIVDLFPTILDFFDIQSREIDGRNLT